jgi:hypothetical protein
MKKKKRKDNSLEIQRNSGGPSGAKRRHAGFAYLALQSVLWPLGTGGDSE